MIYLALAFAGAAGFLLGSSVVAVRRSSVVPAAEAEQPEPDGLEEPPEKPDLPTNIGVSFSYSKDGVAGHRSGGGIRTTGGLKPGEIRIMPIDGLVREGPYEVGWLEVDGHVYGILIEGRIIVVPTGMTYSGKDHPTEEE